MNPGGGAGGPPPAGGAGAGAGGGPDEGPAGTPPDPAGSIGEGALEDAAGDCTAGLGPVPVKVTLPASEIETYGTITFSRAREESHPESKGTDVRGVSMPGP